MVEDIINWSAIENKIPNTSYELFRFWTQKNGLSDRVIIKTEQILVNDFKGAISDAIVALNAQVDRTEKPPGWDVGFVIGFVDGNLGKHWYHEYIIKNGKEYKTFIGLKALESYLEFKKIERMKIDSLYEELLKKDSNIENQSIMVSKVDLSEDDLTISENLEEGKILTILNNLKMRQVKIIIDRENKIRLPIKEYLTTGELKKFITDNKPENQ